MKKVRKIVVIYLVACGIALNVFLLWMAAGWPILIDRWLVKTERPVQADYIVCLSGGVTGDNLPSEAGWRRVYTAFQLYLDGYGKKIVFSGGGASEVSEAEVYAEAVVWLGCPEHSVAFEPGAGSTADHPLSLLRSDELGIGRESGLNIVTSPLHSCRTALCFKKAGFKNFRVVTNYVSRKQDPALVRQLRTSRFESFRPSGKTYDDILMRLRWRSSYFFEALREAAAIGWYWINGKI
jgi:uncharacterized SAM-binding protein YcdF (DUF218 family)